MISPVQRVQVC